jgi:hypothetical protein
MKKTLTSILFLLLINLASKAQQQISNGGFEKWDTIGLYSQPTDWHTLNPLARFGFDPSTTLSTDAHSGKYAARLESLSNSSTSYAGLLSSGPVLDKSLNPVFDMLPIGFTSRPKRLQFYYKSFPQKNDTCALYLGLTKWNATTRTSDTIGYASMLFPDSITNYTLADIALTYKSNQSPDSMFVIISSSLDGFNPSEGSVFLIDDISLVYNHTGIENLVNSSVSVYPNPAKDVLQLDFIQPVKAQLSLQNLLGETLKTANIDASKMQLDVSELAEGIYIINILEDTGKSQVIKIYVQH